ncbi:MAG: threonine--tRNA ligase [Parcubacteria group bacterium]|nr:threonine--tRNA ligase [Parcubacteria group bacterium]
MSEEKNNKLEMTRHSLSHIMAAAILKLYPKVKFAIGPAVADGFYYDLDFGKQKISDGDLIKIEEEMKNIIKANLLFEKFELPIAKALAREKKSGQVYKLELIKDFKKSGEKFVSYYKLGQFTDLCRGPHIKSAGQIQNGSWRLEKLAGAYWRGDEKNKMLTRIYGLAFAAKAELANYLKMLEEAEKRDHRKLGKELDLFSFHEVAPGMTFFHPKGAVIYEELKKFWVKAQKEFDYQYVYCPSMLDVSIWKQSGHWDHYKDDMYFLRFEDGEKQYALRPMDCPGAILIYNNSLKSYRDLPLRYAEPGLITRKEKSGQLNGLLRVQQFTQDDAHIFITADQVEGEIKNVISLVDRIYAPFGMKYKAYLSTRPDDFMGDIESWNKAEKALKKILDEIYGAGNYGLKEKDGAFYGPKIDYQLEDAIGRTWQCATVQLDFQMPLKFGCKYIDNNGKEAVPVLIHRTIMGSFERFMGILIEHYVGAFPLWLSPVQVKIISVGQAHAEYCRKLAAEFEIEDIRVEVDETDETVGNKIRKAVAEKAPYMLVVGDREMASTNLSVRDRGEKQTREINKAEFIKEVREKIKKRK